MSTNIYVLRLQGGRYYVGKSNDVTARYQEHLSGNGSAWTRAHKPVALEREIRNASAFDEDKITKELMAKHGIDKVRGGSYVATGLPDYQVKALTTEIRTATDLCTGCGSKGHFISSCQKGAGIRPFLNKKAEWKWRKEDDEEDDEKDDEKEDEEEDGEEDDDDYDSFDDSDYY
jgi:predicted GIY-YIG superfamily endonuclease